MRARSALLLGASLWLGAYAASSAPAQEASPEDIPQLHWLVSGDGVVVANRWIAHTNGASERLPEPMSYSTEKTPRWSASISPNGRNVLWHDGSPELRLGPVGSWDLQNVRVPLWVTAPDEETPVRVLPAWRSDDELWIEQIAYRSSSEPERACATYQVAPRTWKRERTERCVAASFSGLGAVEPSGSDGWAVYSGAEGVTAVDLVSPARPDVSLG